MASSAVPLPSSQQVRWGFVSTANIGKSNAKGIHASGLATLYAVASRDLQKAKQYAEEVKAEKAYGSYDELLSDDQIDALYLPTPTTHRTTFALTAIAAGKHLLIDKPVCNRASEVQAIIAAANNKNLIWLDGVHNMHNPRLAYVRSCLSDSDRFGHLQYVEANMSLAGMQDPEYVKSNIRLDKTLEPLGALGDLGWYTTRMILFAAAYEIPTSVTASATFWDRKSQTYTSTAEHGSKVKGVIVTCSALIEFPSGVTGTMSVSFDAPFRASCDLTGTKGRIHIPDYVKPKDANASTFQFSHPAVGKSGDSKDAINTQVTIKHKMDQVTLMWRNASRLIAAQKANTESDAQKKGAASEVEPPAASVQHWDQPEVTVDSDADGQLDVLLAQERDRIDYPHLTLLTQAVSDAIDESANNGGQRVKVNYSGSHVSTLMAHLKARAATILPAAVTKAL